MMASDELRLDGVCVIPCVDPDKLPEYRAQFDNMVRAFPEFLPGARKFVMGGFSALGNPASFHNPFVRLLRQWAMYAAVTELWADYIPKYKPNYRLEQCIDRMMLRLRGDAPSPESWHRDEAVGTAASDETFGGWINLDDQDQFFNCVKQSHAERPNKGGGFAPIKSADEKAMYKARAETVAVPPGHMIVFFEHIVHEVRSKKVQYDMYRLFTGWRITDSHEPLVKGLDAMLYNQAVIPLKSNQTPPMYAKLNWTNHRDGLAAFSAANIQPQCRENRRVESGNDKGTVYNVVHREMRSLREYGMRLYPAYTSDEIRMHKPNTSWIVATPGRKRIMAKITIR